MQIPGSFSRRFPGEIVYSTPVVSLIAANIITIILAILENWDLATVMFIYWAQSIIIGLFTVMTLLMLTVPPQPPGGEQSGQQPGKPNTIYIQNPWVAKGILIGIFAVPYGVFHWAYFSFIVDAGIFGIVHFSDPLIWVSCGMFFANHLYSYIAYKPGLTQGVVNFIGGLFLPFRRIIPMHMTIIFGGFLLLILQFAGIQSTLPVLVLFLVIKTWVDVGAHVDKHRPGIFTVPV
jgi:hypothetical protein